MSLLRFCILLLLATNALGESESRIQYLGNEGVAVFHESTTLLFDPLFREDYGRYALVPDRMRNAILDARAPFQSVTAVFVSHHHGDHFHPADVLRLMQRHGNARLYAPKQAISAMRQVADDDRDPVFDRTIPLDLGYDDLPVSIRSDNIVVEAFSVPHSGWPNRHIHVRNIAFRVTVDGQASVVHFGDADPNLIHFERHYSQWRYRQVGAALPPYWFFNSRDGNRILSDIVRTKKSIGVHVPASFSEREHIPQELRGFDLFTEPGETRSWLPAN